MGRVDKDNIDRVFIISDSDYPSLDATSNYIRNFAKCLASASKEVKIVSVNRDVDEMYKSTWQMQEENISFLRLSYPVSNKLKTLVSRATFGERVWEELIDMDINSSDRVVVYTQRYAIANSIIDKCRKNGIRVSAIVVEWFDGKNSNQDKCYKIAYPKCDSIIAISKNIGNYFEAQGIQTMLLPPMIDVSGCNERYNNFNSLQDKESVNLLYTGNFIGKDDMRVMLEALSCLSEDVLAKIEFHITRFEEKDVVKATGIAEDTWERIKGTIITHGDVTADELGKLLMNADYLPIARQVNRTTISNFPSKVPESMAFGIVPIMTLVGDCANDYLTDGVDSILFDECTPECCAKAFERAVSIVCDEDGKKYLELRKEAYNTAVRRFDIVNYSSQLAEFLF